MMQNHPAAEAKDKGRVLFVGNFFSRTGGQRSVCEDIADRMKAKNWTVTTTSTQTNRFLKPLEMLWTIARCHRRYDVANVDVFSDAAFRWAEMAGKALQRKQKPFVLTLHGGKLGEFAQKEPERMKRLLGRAQSVVSPSQFLRTQLQRFGSEIAVIPNAIDLDQYSPIAQPDRARLCWLRSLHSIYNPMMAVKCVQILKQRGQNVQLMMVGRDRGDGTAQTLRRYVAENDLVSHITFVPGVAKAQVPATLRTCGTFLNTTRYESFGISVVEAAACGLCLVTTNVGELPFLWKQDRDACLVPDDDVEAMANAVGRILKDPAFASCLAENARRQSRNFCWEQILPQWEHVFEKIAREHH